MWDEKRLSQNTCVGVQGLNNIIYNNITWDLMSVRFNKLSQQNLSRLPVPHLLTLPLGDRQQYEWSEDRIALKMSTQHSCTHSKSTFCPRNLKKWTYRTYRRNIKKELCTHCTSSFRVLHALSMCEFNVKPYNKITILIPHHFFFCWAIIEILICCKINLNICNWPNPSSVSKMSTMLCLHLGASNDVLSTFNVSILEWSTY